VRFFASKQKGTNMKKIILAAMVAATTFAISGVAEARYHPSKHNRYSSDNYAVEDSDPLASVFGGANEDWGVSPQPRFNNKRQSKAFREEQEDHWGFGHASNTLVALGYDLQRRGFRVSEHPHFGGVHHVHANHSSHYAGRAIDINVGRGVVEAHSGYANRFDQLAAELRSEGYTVLWRVAGHYNHMHVQH
jgi:hypothetical protein